MTNPFFSIVMPAYNCEDTIEATIASINKQTWSDFECIIINDGSTDNTKKVVESIIKNDYRFKLYTKENAGPGVARNKGIEIAKGNYLYLIDSDDIIPPKTLEIYANNLNKYNVDLIVSSYSLNIVDKDRVVDEKIVHIEKELLSTSDEFLGKLHELMEQQLMYVIWNKVYNLKRVKDHSIEFPSYRSCEDRLFNLQYYEHVNQCLLLPDILYNYSFDGKNSLTNRFIENKFQTFEEFYSVLINLTEDNKDISSALFLKGTMSCIIPLHSKDCPYTLKRKFAEIKTILFNKNVIEASEYSKKNTSPRLIMALLFKSKSVLINYLASYVLYRMSRISPKIVEKLKKNY